MKNEIIVNENMFDSIKHIDEFGNEYWEARELQTILGYKEWRKFNGVIDKAMIACKSSNYEVSEHFVGTDKLFKSTITTIFTRFFCFIYYIFKLSPFFII